MSEKITPGQIKAKLADIQTDATGQVESAKSQLLAIGTAAAVLLIVLAFFFGRRAGAQRNTIIEVTRA
ncbi:MAG: hypothetical protein R2698_11655 [Microthrixaceae bacterium]